MRRWVSSAPCVLECRIFWFMWLLMTWVCLGASQRSLLKAAQHRLFSCGLSFWHDTPFIWFCFQNLCMQISRGTHQGYNSHWPNVIHASAFVFSFLSTPEQEAPLWEDEGRTETQAEGNVWLAVSWGCLELSEWGSWQAVTLGRSESSRVLTRTVLHGGEAEQWSLVTRTVPGKSALGFCDVFSRL